MKRTKSAKGTHMRTTAIPALLATMALLLLATGGASAQYLTVTDGNSA